MSLAGLAPHSSQCGTVETLPFTGFTPPVANPPAVNSVQPGSTVPVQFGVPGSGATLPAVPAAGYPQSAPVSCSSPDLTLTGSGDATTPTDPSSADASDSYQYLWQTNVAYTGCRELIVKLGDGSYHRAVFRFGS